MYHSPIYIYEANSTDFSTTGLCGDLFPKEAIFEEEKNGLSQVTMRLAYDKWGKWKYVTSGRYIKASVPVRVPPAIVDGDYTTTVTRYETIHQRVPVYAHGTADSILGSIIETGAKLYGAGNTEAIVGNYIPAQTHPLKPGESGFFGERLMGWFPKTSVRKIDEIAIAPASYGMESITDLVTRLSSQFFRIVQVVQGDDEIEVTAEHIFYELNHNYTSYHPAEAYEVSGSTCVNEILANTYSPVTKFEISSSSSETKTGIDYDQRSVVEALLDPTNGACALYKMVLLRDNWNIYCLPEADVGYDRGFVVEYGKNMISVERTENVDKLVTRVVAYGKDSGGKVKYPENRFVDSEYIDDYAMIGVELFDTGLQIGKDDVTERNFDEKVRAEAQKRFTEDKADIPEVEMKVNFLSLGDTEEYVQFRNLDKVYLYDKITIKDTLRGYSYTAEVVGVKHNILTGQLEEVTLGSIINSDGKRKIAVWQVPKVDGGNIRLKSIPIGVLGDGSVTTEAILDGSITTPKVAALAIGEAQIDDAAITTAKIQDAAIETAKIADAAITSAKIVDASITSAKIADAVIGDAKIESAGISYAKIKELDAESAFFGRAVFEAAVGDKLYVPRLLFNTAQGRQMVVEDLIIGSESGDYYSLEITESDGVISMTPTLVEVSASEIAQGHTTDGRAIIGTTATYEELATEDLFAIDAIIDRITAKRINVDELWARQAFINKLNVQDLSSNTYIRGTVGGWASKHGDQTITDSIDGINEAISGLGRGQIYYSATEPDSPSEGDLWILPKDATTWDAIGLFTWNAIEEYTWNDLGLPPGVYTWNGTSWLPVNDTSMYEVLETQITQTNDRINLKASQSDLTLLGERVTRNEAQISIYADSIEQEVIARQSGDSAARSYADGVAGDAEASAKASSIQKTIQYQTATDIVDSAKTYVDGQLTGYSTLTQTAQAITAEVTKIENGTTAVGKVSTSKVTIDANGIQLKTNGTFTVASGNFAIAANGDVTMRGNVTASAGAIGGWTIGTNRLSAGSGTGYVGLATSGTYAIWAGAESSGSAPFRVNKNGQVYITSLMVQKEDGSGYEPINLTSKNGSYPLWKLSYSTIKSWTVSGGAVTINTTGGDITFNTAAAVRVSTIELYGDPSAAATSLTVNVHLTNGTSSLEGLPVNTYRNRVFAAGRAEGEAQFTFRYTGELFYKAGTQYVSYGTGNWYTK